LGLGVSHTEPKTQARQVHEKLFRANQQKMLKGEHFRPLPFLKIGHLGQLRWWAGSSPPEDQKPSSAVAGGYPLCVFERN